MLNQLHDRNFSFDLNNHSWNFLKINGIESCKNIMDSIHRDFHIKMSTHVKLWEYWIQLAAVFIYHWGTSKYKRKFCGVDQWDNAVTSQAQNKERNMPNLYKNEGFSNQNTHTYMHTHHMASSLHTHQMASSFWEKSHGSSRHKKLAAGWQIWVLVFIN